jgi:hypothetical protein
MNDNEYDKIVKLILDRKDELIHNHTGKIVLILDYQHSIHITYGGSSDDHIYISEIDLRERNKSFWHPEEHSVSSIYYFNKRISESLFNELRELIQEMDTKLKKRKDIEYEANKRSVLQRFIKEVKE